MTTTKLTPPAPLDPSRLYTPTEVDQWKSAWLDYRDAIKAQEAAERMKQQAAEAHDNRVLSSEEYHALSVQRHAEAQAKLAERQAAEKDRQDAEAAYIASFPDIAEVMERSEFQFLTKVGHWFARGYTIADDSIQYFNPGCYAVRLHRPIAASRSK